MQGRKMHPGTPVFCRAGIQASGEGYHAERERKVETLLRAMTLEEKVGQLSLSTSSWDHGRLEWRDKMQECPGYLAEGGSPPEK